MLSRKANVTLFSASTQERVSGIGVLKPAIRIGDLDAVVVVNGVDLSSFGISQRQRVFLRIGGP